MFGWSAEGRRGVRAATYGVVAVALGAVLAVVPLGFAPEQVANATNCISSVTCNPANIPMLVESGVLSGVNSAGAATTVAASSTAATAGRIALKAGQSVLGLVNLHGMLSGHETVGTLSTSGVVGQSVKTDPNFAIPLGDLCQVFPSAAAVLAATGAVCAGPVTVSFPNGSISLSDSLSVSGNVATVVWSGSKTGSPPVNSYAGDVTYGAVCRTSGGTVSITSAGSIWLDLLWQGYTTSPQCAAGSTAIGVAFRTPGMGSTSYYANRVDNSAPPPATSQHAVIDYALQCKAAGLVVHTITFSQDVAWVPGADMPLADVTCGPGEVAQGVEIGYTPDGGARSLLVDPVENPVLPAVKEMPDTYPDCYTALAKACLLILEKIAADGSTSSCGSVGQYCEDWAKDSLARDHYKCRYGNYIVDLDLCSAYRLPRLGILPNVKEDGTPIPYTAPAPDPLPNPVLDPDGNPAVISPAPGEVDSPDSGDCWPSGWGVFNPLAWVYMPVKCATVWAFVPDPVAVQTDLATAARAWDETAPAKATKMVSGLLAAIPDGVAGCSGITINWPALEFFHSSAQTFQFLNACDEPLSTVAAFTSLIGAAGMLWWGTLAVIRYGSAVFGFVGIGGKKDE